MILFFICTGEEEVEGKSQGSDEELSLVDKQIEALEKEEINGNNSFSDLLLHIQCHATCEKKGNHPCLPHS